MGQKLAFRVLLLSGLLGLLSTTGVEGQGPPPPALPPAGSPQAAGRQIFITRCASCHGTYANGGDLFDHYWRKLLRSYAVEAMTRPSYRMAASRDNAYEFLRRLNGRETQETEPGVYRWREIKEGQLAQIELDALQPKPMTLHRLLLHRTS